MVGRVGASRRGVGVSQVFSRIQLSSSTFRAHTIQLEFYLRLWHKNQVSIWLERFCLAVLVGLFLGAVLLNNLKLDGIQRIALGATILGASIFVAQTIHIRNHAQKQSVDTTPASKPNASVDAEKPPTSPAPTHPTLSDGLLPPVFTMTFAMTDSGVIRWRISSQTYLEKVQYRFSFLDLDKLTSEPHSRQFPFRLQPEETQRAVYAEHSYDGYMMWNNLRSLGQTVDFGDRLFGYVELSSKNYKDRAYWFYINPGKGGWYSQVEDYTADSFRPPDMGSIDALITLGKRIGSSPMEIEREHQ